MNKVMREMLDRAIELAEKTPPPKDELKRRTYDLGKTRSKRILYSLLVTGYPFNVEYY